MIGELEVDLLGLFYSGIGILVIIGIGFLFLAKKEKVSSGIMVVLTVLSVLTTLLSVSSMPSNFMLEKIIAVFIGIISLIGCIMRIRYGNMSFIPKCIVALSAIATYLFMLFVM